MNPVEKDESSIHQRLRDVVNKLADGKQARFAERVGIGTGAVGDIFGSRKSKPGYDLLVKILSAYSELRAEWLLLGEGEMLKKQPSVTFSEEPQNNFSYMAPSAGENSVGEGVTIGEPATHGGITVPTFGTPPARPKKAPAAREPLGMDLLRQIEQNTKDIQDLKAPFGQLQERQPTK